jgi:hypothetical protein
VKDICVGNIKSWCTVEEFIDLVNLLRLVGWFGFL